MTKYRTIINYQETTSKINKIAVDNNFDRILALIRKVYRTSCSNSDRISSALPSGP